MARHTDHFKADHLTDDLRGRSVRGVALMFSANAGRIVIGLGSAAALGRLLDPEDFGLVAMVAAVTALFDRVRTIGLGAPTVQRAEINHRQVSNLFWVNVVFGLLMTIGFAAMAPVIEWFYDDSRLVPITLALSLSFLVTGLTVQHGALLRRQMRFRSIAIIELLSEAVAVAAAIVTALLGAGYWALVVLNLAALATRCIATVIICRWIPGWPSRGAGVRGMLVFGGQITTSAFVQSIVDRIDRILIGKVIGADALGYYTRAFFVLIIPVNRFHGSMRSVTVPSLSRIQDDPGRYRYFYRQAAQLTALVLIPAVLLALVAAEPLALTLLGPKWGGSVPIIRAFAPAALVSAIWPVLSWVYFSLGRGDRLMRWTIIESALTLAGIVIGVQWGAVGVAAGYSIARTAAWPWSVSYCFRGTFLRWADLSASLWRPVLASAAAALVVVTMTMLWLSGTMPAIALCIDVAVFGVIYAATWLALPGGVRTIREMVALRAELRVAGQGRRKNVHPDPVEPDDTSGS